MNLFVNILFHFLVLSKCLYTNVKICECCIHKCTSVIADINTDKNIRTLHYCEIFTRSGDPLKSLSAGNDLFHFTVHYKWYTGVELNLYFTHHF